MNSDTEFSPKNPGECGEESNVVENDPAEVIIDNLEDKDLNSFCQFFEGRILPLKRKNDVLNKNVKKLKEEKQTEEIRVIDLVTENERLAKALKSSLVERDCLEKAKINLEQKVLAQTILIENLEDTKHKLSSIESRLKEELECPVCHSVPREGKIPVCENGHITCAECKRSTCPICRVEMEDLFSPLAFNISELVFYSCANKENGCMFTSFKTEINIHEAENCEFADKMYCPFFEECETMCSENNILSHIESCEHGDASYYNVNGQQSYSWDNEAFGGTNGFVVPTSKEDKIFITELQVGDEYMFVPKHFSTDGSKKYTIELKIFSPDGSVVKYFKGETIPLEKSFHDIRVDEDAFVLSKKAMLKIVTVGDDGNYHCKSKLTIL